MSIENSSIMERYPKTTISITILSFLIASIILAEIILQNAIGLGNPPLYDRNPHYGFRLNPNQKMIRFYGAKFNINNLGLRSQQDWDSNVEDKVLFLGDSVTHGGNRISNENLFSEIAVQNLSGYLSGNAGVPNWGVENVYGLIVTEGFLPAKTYVTTFLESDFYRGLVFAGDKPWIWSEPPQYALVELSNYLWYQYVVYPWRKYTARNLGDPESAEVKKSAEAERAERAVKKLRYMDTFLKSNGYRHLIYISPRRAQVLGSRLKDKLVAELLARHGVEAVYLLDRLDLAVVTNEEKASWFQDAVHLTEKGHGIWGALMRVDLRKALGNL